MKSNNVQRLAMERALQAVNPLWVLVLALSLAILVLWLSVLPKAQTQWVQNQQALQTLRQQMALTPVEPAVQTAPRSSGLDFQTSLGQLSEVESYVGTLLNLSQTLDMPALTGEYKLLCDAASRLCRYRVRLPLVGSYLQIRAFVEQSLLELPFASLDELSLRREGIASGELEAGLTYSLHLAYPAQGVRVSEEKAP
jgi:hypothetical protein